MRKLLGPALAAVCLWVAVLDAAPRKGVCPVCRVHRGESAEEPVRAVRTRAGVEYGFCSERCAREFDADPVAYLPPPAPAEAPPLHVRDLAGRPIRWEDLRGRVVLVDFWATWCAPCRKSMPELQRLHDAYGPRGFQVLGVSIDEGDAKSKVKRYLASRKITYPIALDSEDDPTWEAFKVKSVPAAFLVDAQGRLVARWTGAVSAAEVEQRLVELLPAEE